MYLKPPTIPLGIGACTFSYNLSRNSCVHNVTSSTVTTRSGPLLFITSRECISPFFFIFFFFRPEEKEPLLLLVACRGRGGGGGGRGGEWGLEVLLKSFVCSCFFARVLFRVLTISCHHELLDITVTYLVCY